MKDVGQASYVIGTKIHRDKNRDILGFSQETYINKVFEEVSDEGLFTKCGFYCKRQFELVPKE